MTVLFGAKILRISPSSGRAESTAKVWENGINPMRKERAIKLLH
jgi:hypothetical protein